MEDALKTIQDEAITLLERLGISGSVEVESDEDNTRVLIDSDENALLIGKHGNTLSSLEYILTLLVSAKLGDFHRLQIEIGGYREDREQYLKDLAVRMKEEVTSSGTEKKIHGLKAWERRLIHMYLGEEDQVTTESTGDTRDRVLIIKKK